MHGCSNSPVLFNDSGEDAPHSGQAALVFLMAGTTPDISSEASTAARVRTCAWFPSMRCGYHNTNISTGMAGNPVRR